MGGKKNSNLNQLFPDIEKYFQSLEDWRKREREQSSRWSLANANVKNGQKIR